MLCSLHHGCHGRHHGGLMVICCCALTMSGHEVLREDMLTAESLIQSYDDVYRYCLALPTHKLVFVVFLWRYTLGVRLLVFCSGSLQAKVGSCDNGAGCGFGFLRVVSFRIWKEQPLDWWLLDDAGKHFVNLSWCWWNAYSLKNCVRISSILWYFPSWRC